MRPERWRRAEGPGPGACCLTHPAGRGELRAEHGRASREVQGSGRGGGPVKKGGCGGVLRAEHQRTPGAVRGREAEGDLGVPGGRCLAHQAGGGYGRNISGTSRSCGVAGDAGRVSRGGTWAVSVSCLRRARCDGAAGDGRVRGHGRNTGASCGERGKGEGVRHRRCPPGSDTTVSPNPRSPKSRPKSARFRASWPAMLPNRGLWPTVWASPRATGLFCRVPLRGPEPSTRIPHRIGVPFCRFPSTRATR